MTDAVAARIVDEFGADQGAEVVELARAFMSAPPTPPSARRRRVIPILRSQARAAVGADNDVVAARLVHETAEALVGSDATEDEAVECALAMLKQIGPRDVREAMIARRLIDIDAPAVETIALAKASPACCATPMLGKSLRSPRRRRSWTRRLNGAGAGGQRVVEVKHVVVHSGGQAIVGRVHPYRPGASIPAPLTTNERPEPAARPHRRTGRPPAARSGNTQTVKHGLRRAAFVEHRRMVVAMIREARALILELR